MEGWRAGGEGSDCSYLSISLLARQLLVWFHVCYTVGFIHFFAMLLELASHHSDHLWFL